MTRDEFLACFPLNDPATFHGRGPHRARDNAAGGKDVLVHLLDESNPGDASLARRVARLSGSGATLRIFQLDGAIAVVTPDDPVYASLEHWLDTQSAAAPSDSTVEPPGTASGERFVIRFRPPVPRSDQSSSGSPPSTPAPAPSPGEFTALFGSHPSSPAPPAPNAPASRQVPLADPVPPPAPETDKEGPGEFTQLFGGPAPRPQPMPGSQLPVETPRFDRDEPAPPTPPPPPPPPAASNVPPPASSDEPGEFTRFFGTPEKKGEPPSGLSGGLGESYQERLQAPRFEPPVAPAPLPIPSVPPAPAPPAAGPSAYTQVVSGPRLPEAKGPTLPTAASAPPVSTPSEPAREAPAGATVPRPSPIPLVLIISLAVVAALLLIVVVLLLG